MELIDRFSFQRKLQTEVSVSNYEITDENLLLQRLEPDQTIRNCRFKNVTFHRPVSSLILENCAAEELKITAHAGIPQGLGGIRLTNCKIAKVEIEIKSQNATTDISTLTVNGIDSVIGKILLSDKGFNQINIEHVLIDEVTFHFINAESIKINSIKNANLKFTNAVVKKSAFFLSNSNTHLEFFETNIPVIGVMTPEQIKIDFISSVSKTIKLYGGTYQSINFKGTGEFDFLFTAPSSDGTAESSVSNISIVDFYLISKSRIKLRGLRIAQIDISDFENDGSFAIDKCSVEENLQISSSNLGKANFNNTSVEQSSITILDSNLIDCQFTNFKWRPDYVIHPGKDVDLLSAIRETYRQLKANYLKNGNKIEALEFQKNELDTHYQLLKSVRPKGWFTRERGNYLIVSTNKWFSDFGQNIWKPLSLLLGAHLVFFNLLLLTNHDLGVHFAWSWDTELFFRGIKLYFQTLLPVHSSDLRLEGGKTVPIAGFWDFIIRVSSGYFIFYFISASRKYHQ